MIRSALSYIPEQAWNDDSATYGEEYGAAYALSSGGGGTSTLTARPSWQTGVTGISSGTYRMVPDISLDSSPNNAGYLYCTSDSSAWSSGQEASCNDGFRDSSSQYLTAAGGTSFAAPIFAGMMAIISQKQGATGLGLINSTLYSLAADSGTYASAFHDITGGSNKCTAGLSFCSSAGESEYVTATGYNEGTGLGSIDLYNLMTAWPSSTSSALEATTTSLTAASSSPTSGVSDVISITVSPESSSITAIPTGTLTIAVDGTTETSSLALTNGAGSYTFSSTTSGSHVITAVYSGDSTFAASTSTVTVDVGGSGTTSSTGSIAVSATNVTATQGSSGTSTVTVTSENSFAGTVGFALSTATTALEDYGCYEIGDSAVAANSSATTTLTIYTSESVCTTASSVTGSRRHSFLRRGLSSVGAAPSQSPWGSRAPFAAAFAFGCALPGFGKRRRKLWAFIPLLMLGCV